MIQYRIDELNAEIDLAENKLIENLKKTKSSLDQNEIIKTLIPSSFNSTSLSSTSPKLIKLITHNSGAILSAIKTIVKIKRLISTLR